ncbi:hypothetical protein C1H46_044787 [Malus baccata]|uniref:Uncharacterized protein n=1 Tax=Malus baccata TaxID=106549 RepID=A0A540K715_MALBA|nr:hypothetical protein C1H46_044787 [Malus baccata]
MALFQNFLLGFSCRNCLFMVHKVGKFLEGIWIQMYAERHVVTLWRMRFLLLHSPRIIAYPFMITHLLIPCILYITSKRRRSCLQLSISWLLLVYSSCNDAHLINIQKLVFMDAAEGVTSAMRPYWSEATGDSARVVQTVPDMLEIVPPGTSKGSGVSMLLDHLGITPKEVWITKLFSYLLFF